MTANSITQSVLALVIPAVTIIGLVVLVALGKVDQAAGLGLIGTLAGVHGGAALISGANRRDEPPASRPPPG